MIEEVEKDWLTVTEAANILHIKTQSLYHAIKRKRIKAKHCMGRYLISKEELKNYIDTRYSRANRRDNGVLTFDKNHGHYSVMEACDYLNVTRGRLYYLLRSGMIPHKRVGSAYVINKAILDKFKELITHPGLPASQVVDKFTESLQ